MIGDRLREERERIGLTQPTFAAAAKASKRTVIEWEKGATSPSAVQLAALSTIGIDVGYVLTGKRPGAYATGGTQTANKAAEPSPPPLRPPIDPAWPQVMEMVVDALNERGRRMPSGAKLRELVDAVLVVLRMEEGALDREKSRRKINALL